jgi:hypothetical protein
MRHTQFCCRAVAPSATQRDGVAMAARASRLAVLATFSGSRLHNIVLRRFLAGDPCSVDLTTAAAHSLSPLRCSRATVKSRSLAPDDPFGEKSSWEDPSDGLYSAWKDVDQEGFVNATQSEEVRNAHFGPQWARFTTVGRLSVKKMKEDQAVQPRPSPSTTSSSAGGTAATAAPRQYLSAEDLHEAELKTKRRLLERNYLTYEAFVEHELGAGEGFSEATTSVSAGDADDVGMKLYRAASMESAFSAVEGVDGRDRMAQRNTEREALDTIEAAEVEETVPLPDFIFEEDPRHPSPLTAAAGQAAPAFAPANEEGNGNGNEAKHQKEYEVVRGAAATAAVMSATHTAADTDEFPTAVTRPSHESAAPLSTSIPTAVVRQVLGALRSPHGDQRIPLSDPIQWGTEDIIYYLTLMEQRPADVDAVASRESWTTMDETMCDTFRMAKVTGDTLLNVVVPPRLFRLMRRWHVRRQDVVNKAWKRYQETVAAAPSEAVQGDTRSQGSGDTAEVSSIPEEMVMAVVAQYGGKLDEAVQPLDRVLIQETILLCFPYGR